MFDTWVIEKIKEDIATLGYQDVILKGDGETVLVQALENVKLAREAPSVIQHSPAYDPQANGAAEKAVQDYMGQVSGQVGIEIGLEARLKCKVESDWKIMEWITELAGELLSRGQVGMDGRTAEVTIYNGTSLLDFYFSGLVSARWHHCYTPLTS